MSLSNPETIRSLMDDLRSISHDDSLAWTEWLEDDNDDPAIPVRIQLLGESLYFYWGNPSLDNDSRGYWGYDYVYQDMDDEALRETAIALISDLEDSQW